MGTASGWELGWYRPEDKPGILALNRVQYEDVPLSSEAYFDWLSDKNPAGKPIIPVAREKGTDRVVGFIMFVPMRISWAGGEQRGLIGLNLLVDRDYRRHGVLGKLFTEAYPVIRREHALAYGFPNSQSLPGVLQMEYRFVAKIPVLARPLRIVPLSMSMVSNPVMRWGVNLGWAVASRTVYREGRPRRDKRDFEIVEDAALDESYNHFWHQVKAKYHLMLIRDRAFLQWRFLDIPGRRYQVLSARRNNEILGYVVLSESAVRNTTMGLIADFMVLPGEAGERAGMALLAEAIKRFKRERLCLTGGLILPHTEESTIMRRAGYLRTPEKFAPQTFHLVERVLRRETGQEEPEQAQNWFLSVADHDAV